MYADPLDGEIFHYPDSNGAEVDIIVQKPTAMGACQERLASRDVDLAAPNLLRFALKIDAVKVGHPVVIEVIYLVEYAYSRDDVTVARGRM